MGAPWPGLDTALGDWPWVVIRFRCHVCARQADARLAACAARYGHKVTVHVLLRRFIAGCPWNPHTELRKPQKYGMRCGGYCPDLGRTSPPDLPPAMTGLNLIAGGRADMLPAEPAPLRRRVGGDDV